ncbi:MAG TPA: TrmH family RNA methyltransferase, partial [Candidatus Saccharimonadales bacterium]|nr:TrmH family RNA methyltransferase [Candidatus Saccharimonadales bacterium]
SADGFGLEQVICSGYTPYPSVKNDTRLPHVSRRLTAQIHKTALGAETYLRISHAEDALTVVNNFKDRDYLIIGLEQAPSSKPLAEFQTKRNILLLLGEEVDGLNQSLIEACDVILELAMHGQKESLNVSIAGAIAMYQLSR